jgi:hypothetical protein
MTAENRKKRGRPNLGGRQYVIRTLHLREETVRRLGIAKKLSKKKWDDFLLDLLGDFE